MNLNNHEPTPVRGNNPAVWPEVIKDMDVCLHSFPSAGSVIRDMKERHQFGIQKHGGPLVINDGRRLVDAYQEILDACVYTKKAIMEGGHMRDRLALTDMYCNLLEMACTYREIISKWNGD